MYDFTCFIFDNNSYYYYYHYYYYNYFYTYMWLAWCCSNCIGNESRNGVLFFQFVPRNGHRLSMRGGGIFICRKISVEPRKPKAPSDLNLWLVVTGTWLLFSHKNWEWNNHPNWLIFIFQRDWNHQPDLFEESWTSYSCYHTFAL